MGLRPAERAILAFGIGIGAWHVVLFILGEFNLYYRWVMIALCAVTLLLGQKIRRADPRHFRSN